MKVSVKNDVELRRAYELMLSFADTERDGGEAIRNLVVDYKRAIRKYNSLSTVARVIKDYGIDGCVVLLELPEGIESVDEGVKYFLDHEYREAPHSIYDCTGAVFTSYFKVFERRGRFYAYHSISVDC